MESDNRDERYAEATALLKDYSEDPRRFWAEQGGAERQSHKLEICLGLQSEALGEGAEAVLASAAALALERADRRPPPIYVMGIGGSGSHWLASMLAALVPAVMVGEVHVPEGLRERMRSLPPSEQGFLVDCLHLIHCVLIPPHISLLPGNAGMLRQARMVNAADGVIGSDFRAWDADCFVIHLLRDPRDRVMSVTFRKQEFRQSRYGELSDERYLLLQATNTARNFAAWQSASLAPDFLCRYEELREGTAGVLERIAAKLGAPVDADRIVEVAEDHDASRIRSGATAPKANLFPSPSPGWRQETDERQRTLMHSLLTEVVTRGGYPADDCLGAPLEMTAPAARRLLRFPDDRELGALFTREAVAGQKADWVFLADAVGEVTVPAGSIVKLRVHEAAARESIASLASLPSHGVDSLCLTGNRNLDDDLLASLLASLEGIQELDLSRTAVTDESLPALGALPELRGVGVLKVGSGRGVRALRESSPALKIVSDEPAEEARAKPAAAERRQ
jgi:hypothetical protein